MWPVEQFEKGGKSKCTSERSPCHLSHGLQAMPIIPSSGSQGRLIPLIMALDARSRGTAERLVDSLYPKHAILFSSQILDPARHA